jgi:hypothetical protein
MWAPKTATGANILKKRVKNKRAKVLKQNTEDNAADVPAENVKRKTAKVSNKKGMPRKCPVCCFIMSNLVYKRHFRIDHEGVPFQRAICLYPCPKCYALCKNQLKLECHLTKKHGMEKKYACDECGEKFAYRALLSCHVRNKHTEELCVCEDCGATFDRKYKLTMHKTRKHPRSQRTYPCPECDVTYMSDKGLERHKAVVHGIGKIPLFEGECEDCGLIYRTKDNLRSHAYKVHGRTLPGLKTFTCPICSMVYHTRSHFNKHVRSHAEKPVLDEDEKC